MKDAAMLVAVIVWRVWAMGLTTTVYVTDVGVTDVAVYGESRDAGSITDEQQAALFKIMQRLRIERGEGSAAE